MSTTYSTPTSSFLQARADSLDCEAQQLFARSEVAARFGLCEHAVRLDCRAVELEDYAEVLRLQARRLRDMTQDEREMRQEGYTQAEITRYIARMYGMDVTK